MVNAHSPFVVVLAVYDTGNFIVTSLMGNCADGSDVNDCPLGSLMYRDDWQATETGCFGPDGSYRMLRMDRMQIFLSHNSGDSPMDFMIRAKIRDSL